MPCGAFPQIIPMPSPQDEVARVANETDCLLMTNTLSPDIAVEHFQSVLKQFSSVARDVCNEILNFQPDLVMCLMHTGWLPTYAVMELWNQTQALPFPPLARVNLGLEKMQRFNALETRPRVNGSFVGHMEEDDDQAFFLAWLYDQIHWQEELRELIHEQIGDRSPQRILVIDEFICEGSTWMLTLGLLNLIFTDAKVHFHNASLEYKVSIFLEWLRVWHPELLNSELVSTGMEFHDLSSQAQRMVLGTEDIDPESLRWKTIESTSVCFENL